MKDPHAQLRADVLRRVLDGSAETETSLRNAAANDAALPAELQSLVHKIHAHAYKVTDEDLSTLQTTYRDDQLFEVVVSAALGASQKRLLAGLRALEGA
jgi:hypothetical protein